MTRIPDYITVSFPPFKEDTDAKITCIRAIRRLTSLGLKESKDITEKPGSVLKLAIRINAYGDKSVDPHQVFLENYDILRNNGVSIFSSETERMEKMKQLAIEFINENEFGPASGILAILREYRNQ